MKKTVFKLILLILVACICSIVIYYQATDNKKDKEKNLFEISSIDN